MQSQTQHKIKKALFTVIVLLLMLPLIQHYFKIAKQPKLKGTFVKAPRPKNKKWLNTSYQEAYEKYYNDTIGFRTLFVRQYNQIQYSLFNKIHAKDVEIGKNNYLFEGGYIRDYMGYNFVGKTTIENKIKGLKIIQEKLKQHNTEFLVVLAPGKASFFPEYLPERYDTNKRTISNYQYYAAQCKQQGLNHIDMNKYFKELKLQTKHKLYPKGGIHWGEYGVAVAFDTLKSYIENKAKIKMIGFDFNDVVYEKKISDKDKDLSNLMNLYFEYDYYPMPKPKYKFKHTPNEVKPNLLIVGDSYGSRLIETTLIDSLFNKFQLWYYNKGIESRDLSNTKQVRDLIVKNELKKYDVVMLLSTETNFYKFDFGFTEGYYRNEVFKKNYDYYLKRIAEDKEWNNQLIQKAKQTNIPYDSILSKEALFWANKQKN